MRNIREICCFGAIAVGALCCASFPKPVDRLAGAEASVRTAQEVGAPGVPRAALQLQLAREELDQAQAQIKKGEYEKADGLLMRAQADSELAIALVKANQEQAEAQQLQERLDAYNHKNAGG
jgi:hypothetical protein